MGEIGTTLVGGGWASWCAPTRRQCQNWGGDALLGAVQSFRSGDKPYWVRVKYRDREVIVRVVSYCACGSRRGIATLIDLSPAAMKALEPRYRILGIIMVEIER